MLRSCAPRWRLTLLASTACRSSSSSSMPPCLQACQTRSSATEPLSPPPQANNAKMSLRLETIRGQSGRLYSIERVLQEKVLPSRYVYLATFVHACFCAPSLMARILLMSFSAGNDKFILKNVSEFSFVNYQDMYRSLRDCPYLRVACDTSAPEHSIFIYKYLSDDLLSLAQKDLPLALIKRILKDALRGLVALHDQDIVHTGMLKL